MRPLRITVCILLLAACAKAPPPPLPPEAARLGVCPPPLAFEAGAVVPRWVRLENRMADTLTVFIDRCWRHTLVADVPPGMARQVRLPESVVAYPEGLRFHVFDKRATTHLGVYALPVESRPVLSLVVDGESRVEQGRLEWYDLEEEGSGRGAGRFALGSDEQGAYAAVWADGSPAILTWACSEGDGRRHLALSTHE